MARETASSLELQLSGPIVLSARAKLSLPRLFRLEQDVAQVAGAADARLEVLEDGHVVVHVPPQTRTRVREFLILEGELVEGNADGQ
ncbi:MAG: hypothetical protein HY690_02830 [Chloroflexi bacterium]|nr:hypothetical protein [Chloroflexota bacterium]